MPVKLALGLLILAASLGSSSLAKAGWENLFKIGLTNPSGSTTADPALDQAARAVREGRDDVALVLLRSSTTRDQGSPIRLELARLQFEANQPAKGRRSLEQVAAEAPTDPRVYLILGALALNEGRQSDARLNAEKALALVERTKLDFAAIRAVRREASTTLAAVAEAHEDWASARTHLLAWLDIDPTNAPARQRLGRALFRLGQPKEAYEQLARSAKDDPKLGPAAVPMALLQIQAGEDAKAEEWFAYGAKADPRSATVRLSHARWRLDKGRGEEARSLVEEASRLDANSKEIEPLRGLIAWQLRELATAERIFEGLHRDFPDDPGFAALLTLALVEQDDSRKQAQGLRLAESAAKVFPRALDVLASLGRAQARSGHRDEAERLLRAAIAGAGGLATPTLAYFLAQVLAEKGSIEEARALLIQATATPVAFAYQPDARTLLASLATKTPDRPNAPSR